MKKTITQTDRKNAEIQREQDANAIIALLKRHQVQIENGNIEFIPTAKGVRWNAETIAFHIGVVGDEKRILSALLFLCEKQWVERRGNQFFVTIFGVESYRLEAMRPEIETGAAEMRFRDEVLSGAVEVKGRLEPTTHDNAALPRGSHHDRPDNIVENKQLKRCASIEYIHKIALDNGLEDQDAIDMLTTGEIHRCSRCGLQKLHHRHGGKGGQWDSPCITCKKGLRK